VVRPRADVSGRGQPWTEPLGRSMCAERHPARGPRSRVFSALPGSACCAARPRRCPARRR